jgi:hypothetical protein
MFDLLAVIEHEIRYYILDIKIICIFVDIIYSF